MAFRTITLEIKEVGFVARNLNRDFKAKDAVIDRTTTPERFIEARRLVFVTGALEKMCLTRRNVALILNPPAIGKGREPQAKDEQRIHIREASPGFSTLDWSATWSRSCHVTLMDGPPPTAQIFSSLRRTRPHVPFYRLRTHATPTRWILYRLDVSEARTRFFKPFSFANDDGGDDDMERLAGESGLCLERIGFLLVLSKPKPSWTTPIEYVVPILVDERSAQNGEPKARAFAVRFERLARIRREKDHWRGIYARELFNRPLPRMRNQPLDITMMINKRIKARARRQVAFDVWTEIKEDIKRESAFETNLAKMCGDGPETLPSRPGIWEFEPMIPYEESLKRSFALDDTRANSKYTPEMLLRIKQARTERIANKTREHARERAGEVLNATRRRLRKGAPAHVWAVLSEKNKRRDRVRREVGAGGYSQWVRTGVWGEADEGKEENREMLDRIAREIRRGNLTKRTTGP
ncbi:hypothetical protein BS47DRAFT_1395305 [Hydnum rufescens UP504]|uniref:Uncharacterized protein n=1 Tax=Hydnum rufescens UP504 TaxID=1448309 RepID=A0A9P6ASC1_9AGAM|nr:hypothetical protein BS47DRAFT_1395305 [Hydnum rufescens UP504]